MISAIWREVMDERTRQRHKWAGNHPWGQGDCSSAKVPDIVKATVLAEECGEVSRAVLDHGGSTTRNEQLRTELIQVAAVAIAWLESIDEVGA